MTARTVLGGFCALLMISASAIAQPDSLWSRTFGGSSMDECYSVHQISDGSYILGGYTGSYGAGNRDFWLLKTDADGDSLWTRTFGGMYQDECRSIQQTTDGGYILGGFTYSYGAGSTDFWLLKTDTSGALEWSYTFGGGSLEICYSVQQTTDGGYILGGYTNSFGAGGYDFWFVKTYPGGTEQWSRTFGGSDDDVCWSIQQTSDGGYILGGYTASFGAGSTDFWLVKMDANGAEEWRRTFGGSDEDVCFSVQQTTDGGYILGGYTVPYGVGFSDFWLVKTDASGIEEWNRTFGGSSSEACLSVQQTSDGGYILGGYAASYGAGNADFWLVRADANGDSLWSRTFGGSGQDECRSVQQTTDGGYILGGNTSSYGAGSWDFWLVKTGPDPSAAEPQINLVPVKFALHPNFPNPFNPSTAIRYDVKQTGHVRLAIYNLLGQEVASLVDGQQLAGTHTITWNASNVPSGIYLCRMEADGFAQTRKMLLVK